MPTPPRSLDDMPLAAYGGSGMEADDTTAPTPFEAEQALAVGVTRAPSAAMPANATAARPIEDLPLPDGEPSRGPNPVARLVRLFRTSRLAAGTGFAIVVVVGLVLLSSGGSSPAATAATPTKGPTAAPTIAPPSGDVSMTLSGAVPGTFALIGLADGQRVNAGTVTLAWGDASQTTLTIAGPLDRGTRATDEHLVLTIGAVIAGKPVTFTSNAGQCTIGMAQVGTKVQGSFTCHKLKSADGKLTIEASGTYRN
jgi:hypothetical protein